MNFFSKTSTKQPLPNHLIIQNTPSEVTGCSKSENTSVFSINTNSPKDLTLPQNNHLSQTSVTENPSPIVSTPPVSTNSVKTPDSLGTYNLPSKTTCIVSSKKEKSNQYKIAKSIASLVLFSSQAIPVRLKIVLDRLFKDLNPEEMDELLNCFGWSAEDYQRGYILEVCVIVF